MKIKTYDPVGAANYSLALALAALLLAVPVALAAFKKRTGGSASVSLAPIGRVLSVILLTGAYLLLLNGVGYILLTPVYICGVLFTIGTRRPLTLALVPIAATAVLYLIFRVFFGVLLPSGILGV